MIKKLLVTMSVLLISGTGFALFVSNTTVFAADPCPNGSFFGLPAWHKHLDKLPGQDDGGCTPQIKGLNDIWKIVAAVTEILLRVATLIAIGFIVYGGILYVLSEGSPDKTSAALKTIINALVGLVISITAAVMISFIAGKF